MNKHRYRVVFHQKTGACIAVAETASTHGKGNSSRNAAARMTTLSAGIDLFSLRFARLAVGIAALFGSIAVVDAQVVAYRNAPGNQRPTVLQAGNGVPLVNIQTPSAQGVSRNVYSQFDVDSKGVILNNARNRALTQLGGWVQGNPWLAVGTAKVIVNEVNSANPSYLRGYIEVAGERAQVIIANPSGLYVGNAGFINASRATLTTGLPRMVGGNLDAYRVTGGAVTIDGKGLDARSTDYTEIMARAVHVNANIWANNLNVSTGVNTISADHGVVTSTTGATGATGAAPGQFSIDVARLAGMYAGQIVLVGTEHGVGMNNAGVIGAGAGDVIVTVDGLLQNKGSITATRDIAVTATGLNNQGSQFQAGGSTTLALGAGQLDNGSGLIRSGIATTVTAGSVNNSNTSTPDLGIQGQAVTIAATTLNNQAGALRANTELTVAGTGAVDNTNGSMSAGQALDIHDTHAASTSKTQTIVNTGGTLIAGQQLVVDSAAMTGDGKALSLGDLWLKLDADFTHAGTTQADGSATITTAGKLTNSGKLLAGKTLAATAASMENQAGGQLIGETNRLRATGSHTLTNRGLIDGSDTLIDSPTINNIGTGRIYGDHLAVSGDTLNNRPETVNGVTAAPVMAARVRMDLGVATINNSDHALIYSGGDLVTGNALDASHQAIGMGETINNSSATIAADGHGTINHQIVNNDNAHLETTVDNSTGRRIVQYRLNGSPDKLDSDSVKLINKDSGQIATDWTHMGDEDNFRLMLPSGGMVSEWTIYDGTEQIARTKVTKSDPAMIHIGGNLRFNSQAVNNRNSQIIAGGDHTGNNVLGTQPVNNGETGTQVVTTTGSANYTYIKSHTFDPDDRRYDERPYEGQSIQTSFVLDITPTNGSGVWQDKTLKSTPGTVPGNASMVVRTSNPDISLPDSALFVPGNNRYLIATDPQFANYRHWLSSDFMLTQLSQDPNLVMKRLGDGFYEQQLVQQQIQKAIGQRYAGNYANNEAQYQALMTAGVHMAQSFDYQLGIALTATQMAMLTSDIVWLVKQTVRLADGSTQDVLVPQVYLRANRLQVTGEGTLIAGANVNYQTAGDILNTGTIAAKNTAVLAGNNINNLGGRVSGTDTVLQAQSDINNLGGAIDGSNSATLLAKRDINNNSTSVSTANATTTGSNIDSVASVTGTTLTLAAGRDLTANAAIIGATDATGNVNLSAVRDVNLGTVTEGYTEQIRWADDQGASNWVSTLTGPNLVDQANGAHGTKEVGVNRATVSASQDVATQINGNNISINAGRDLSTKGTQAIAAAALAAVAGNHLNIGTAHASASARDQHQKSSSGILSGKTTQTDDAGSYSRQTGSTLSGNTTVLAAGNNANITGSDVVSTQGTQVTAVNDINIVAATDTSSERHYKKETTSGVFSGGGLGVTVGSKMQSTDQTRTTTTASGSTVGATNGNVILAAGQHYRQSASAVIAPQGDIGISGQQVDITAGVNTEQNTQATKFKQQGITVQITNPVVSAVQTAMRMQDAKQKTRNGRSKILADAATALAAANAAAAVNASAAPAGGVDLAFSIGASSNQSNTVQNGTTSAGSTIAASGNTNITATGAGTESNLTIGGSEVAGTNVNLQADNRINLLGQRNSNEEHSTNKGSAASIGFSIGSSGPRFNASASGSRGKGDGSDSDVTNTHVNARNQLAMTSGGDTNIKGATASGKQVTANVGGSLNVESLQDTSQYKSQQQSLGGSISVGTGVSGSINASRSKVDGNYQSVTEQSGILAGDDGFQVTVNGNTDLKGGKIASTDKAVNDNKNSFTTQTLTTSDLQNKSDHQAESQSFSAGGGYGGGNSALNGTGIGLGKESGSAASTTTSGISGIAGDKTVRSDKDNSNALVKTWNGKELQQDVEAQAKITETFGKQAALGIGTYATKKLDDLNRQIEVARDGGDNALADKLQSDANNWAEGGVYRTALHAAAGALGGGLAGAAGATASALSMPAIAEQIKKMDAPHAVKQALAQVAAAALGAAVGGTAGMASAVNVEANNRQLHQSEYDFAKKNAKVVADALSKKEGREVTVAEAEGRIIAELQRNSDLQTAQASGGKIDYDIRGIVGCKNLNCNGSTTDSQYANNNINSELIAPNQTAYNLGQAQIGTGLTPTEYRNENIVSERIGKGALAITSCALAGPSACNAAAKGLSISLGLSYLTGSPVSTAGAVGSAFGGIIGGIYAQNLAAWAGETSSAMQSATLWLTKTGSVFGGKQVGVAIGNSTALGGSVDPFFDPETNPWWGAKNTFNQIKGEK